MNESEFEDGEGRNKTYEAFMITGDRIINITKPVSRTRLPLQSSRSEELVIPAPIAVNIELGASLENVPPDSPSESKSDPGVSHDVETQINGALAMETVGTNTSIYVNGVDEGEGTTPPASPRQGSTSPSSPRETLSPRMSPRSLEESDEESVYHQPLKDVDEPSAERLAKRLFQLDGFQPMDVAFHLGKKNDFSYRVGEHYLNLFDFADDRIDIALRHFLSKFTLVGETQERERVLDHFARRYVESNLNSGCNSQDSCHTLACAIMLLNTDLHCKAVSRRMSAKEFRNNLSGLNDEDDFPHLLLDQIYESILTDPLANVESDEAPKNEEVAPTAVVEPIGVENPFLRTPDPTHAIEYKRGYIQRKSCLEANAVKTRVGRRRWKLFYAVLRDMVLYLYKDERTAKKAVVSPANLIHIHHALATRANDYRKKPHVFRLKTCDWAEFLVRANSAYDMQDWVETINTVAASLSAKPLPSAVGSSKAFQRPLYPSSYTPFSTHDQLLAHEQRVTELQMEFDQHKSSPPRKSAKSQVLRNYVAKTEFLNFEITRFKTYALLLQSKISSRYLASPPSGSGAQSQPQQQTFYKIPTDRFSYQAAIRSRGDMF